MQNAKGSYSDTLNLESFFLLIKPDQEIYSDNSRKKKLYDQIEKIINSGLTNLEIAWSSNEKWMEFVSKIRLKYPTISLGSASIENKQSIEDSNKIGLEFSMMKFWDKDLFNFARTQNHLLIPGIKNLKDLREAINLNCKIIKIYPVKSKDDSIDIGEYKNIDFIAAGGLSINDLGYYKSIGYKSIVIGDKGFNNQEIDPKIYEFLQRINLHE